MTGDAVARRGGSDAERMKAMEVLRRTTAIDTAALAAAQASQLAELTALEQVSSPAQRWPASRPTCCLTT